MADTTLDIGDLFHERIIEPARADTALASTEYLVSSSDTNVVAVYTPYPFGLRAKHAGTATVTATLRSDPSVAAHMTVHVREARVFLTGVPTRPVEVGTTLTLPARFTGGNSDWVIARSSDPSIVTVVSSVPETVVLQPKRPGTATITVLAYADSSYRTTYDITVLEGGVAKLTVLPASVRLRGRDDSVRVTVTMTSASGALLNDRVPAVTTSDAGIVRPLAVGAPAYNEGGSLTLWIRAVAAGSATIKVQSGTVSADLPVTVAMAAPDSAYVNAGETVSIFPAGNDAASPPPASQYNFDEVVGIAGNPRRGRATIVTPTRVDYAANPGWVGADTILYITRDKLTGATDTGVVRVNVLPGPFTVTALAPPPGTVATVTRVNDRGEVSATLRNPDSTLHAARWTNGQYQVLDNLSSPTQSTAIAINNGGDELVTVGRRPAIWRSGASTATFLFADTAARTAVDMNDRGQVLLSNPPGMIWENGLLTQVPGVLNSCITVDRINNASEVLGHTTCNLYDNWVVLNTTGADYSGCFAGRYSGGADINDAGTVVGTAENQRLHRANMCVWHHGVPATDLRLTLGEWLSSLTRINNSDWLLGTVQTGSTFTPALVANGVVLPLSYVLSPYMTIVPYPWTIVSTVDINNRGQILAYGMLPDGTRMPVLLTPGVQCADPACR